MERVVKHGTRWYVAYRRGSMWVAPTRIGEKDAPLAVVGPLEYVVEHAYGYANERDARKRATDLFPYDGSAHDRRKAA